MIRVDSIMDWPAKSYDMTSAKSLGVQDFPCCPPYVRLNYHKLPSADGYERSRMHSSDAVIARFIMMKFARDTRNRYPAVSSLLDSHVCHPRYLSMPHR